MSIQPNALYQTDCLALLERIPDEQINLVYLDPPWFSDEFTDTHAPLNESFQQYLNFLSRVFQQAQRVLADSGSLYMHSEPGLTAYVRILLDQIFRKNFRGEFIIPKLRRDKIGPSGGHESVLMYSKSNDFYYKEPTRPLSQEETRSRYSLTDNKGPFRLADLTSSISRPNMRYEWQGITPSPGRSWRYTKEKMAELAQNDQIYFHEAGKLPRLKIYLTDSSDVVIGNVWEDLPPWPNPKERMNYSTQRPLALLERIVVAGSKADDIIFDPFCGSGTALIAAQQLGRRWIGGDNSAESFNKTTERLLQVCKQQRGEDFNSGDQRHLIQNHPIINRAYRVIDISLQKTNRMSFYLGQALPIEENLVYEFKEVKGGNAARSIRDVVDQYAVAFLNREGGSIYWGVRNSDRIIVGVRLTYAERDEIRRTVSEHLNGIKPAISPAFYKFELHQVISHTGLVEDLYVVELSIPTVASKDLYFTVKDEAWIKTQGGKKELKGPQLQQEILRRFNID
jgi:DNA modification methylase